MGKVTETTNEETVADLFKQLEVALEKVEYFKGGADMIKKKILATDDQLWPKNYKRIKKQGSIIYGDLEIIYGREFDNEYPQKKVMDHDKMIDDFKHAGLIVPRKLDMEYIRRSNK